METDFRFVHTPTKDLRIGYVEYKGNDLELYDEDDLMVADLKAIDANVMKNGGKQ